MRVKELHILRQLKRSEQVETVLRRLRERWCEAFLTPPNTPSIQQTALSPPQKPYPHTVLSSGGVVRSIENVGIRKMPHRVKSKFQDAQGIRYHNEARLVSMRFVSNPSALMSINRAIREETHVIRSSVNREKGEVEVAKGERLRRNPWALEE